MNKYVVAFIFTPGLTWVNLIRKNKPQWQKGALNGIGGKIEEGESPMQAVIRELKEESGTSFEEDNLIEVGMMKGTNNDESAFEVYIFTGVHKTPLIDQEEEPIDLYMVDKVSSVKHVENIPMLIEACMYRIAGKSHFDRIIMEYNPGKKALKAF